MRRLGALLLILLFVGCPVISALAATSGASSLPECCKKHGAHMCSVRHSGADSQTGNVQVRALCPFASHFKPAITAQGNGLAERSRQDFRPLLIARRSAHPRLLALVSAWFVEYSKRGPPLTSSVQS